MALTKGVVWLFPVALATLLVLTGAPASAAPTAVSTCQTIGTAGNYAVTADLNSPGASCLVITTNGVGIDLGGHTITGDKTAGTSAITDNGAGTQHIVIANGNITGFDNGVSLTGSSTGYGSYVTIDKLNSSGNKSDGVLLGSYVSAVTNSTFNNNGADGIRIRNCCNTFSKVIANANTGNGIVTLGCCALVTDSQAENNGSAGIVTNDCCNFLTNLTVMTNGADGIDGNFCCNNVTNGTVQNNKGSGVVMSGGENAVDGSNVSNNTGDGINLTGGFNLVNASAANSNGGDGVALDRGKGSGNDLVTDSTASSNSGNGMTLSGTGAQNVVSKSTTSSNTVDGLSIVCPGNILMLTSTGNGSANLATSGICTQL
jgi:parallel beta helix pectate lyase-like protein